MRRLRTSSRALSLPALPDLAFSGGVVCPIRLKEDFVGLVWITDGAHAISDLDGRAAEHAAVIAALQIARQRELAAKEAQFGSTLLDSLLEGRFEATPQAVERAQLLGFNPEVSYRVGLFVLDEALPLSPDGFLRRERIVSRLQQRLQFLEVTPLLSVSLNRVLFLLPAWCAGERIWNALREKGLALAFGQARVGVASIQHSYQEALSLLPFLPMESFHTYETLLLPRVLLGDQEARRIFLAELLDHFTGQRNGEMLLKTLLAWARSGFEHAMVAEQLHIHAKTLHYRLARAADLAKLNLADPQTRFRLHLAAYLFSLEGKNVTDSSPFLP
jgi:purine catabolism regulator